MYISRYLKIRAEYEPQIQHYQELAEKEKKTLKEIEKGMDDDRREYEAELKECEKEWKAERASSDYKNELKEYEKARRRGDEVAARTLKRLMDAVDDNYRAEVEKKQNSYNRFQREPLELCEEWKSIVKCYEAIVNRLRNYQNTAKQYVDAVAKTALKTTSIIPVKSIQILSEGTSTNTPVKPDLYRNTLMIAGACGAVCAVLEIIIVLILCAFKKPEDHSDDEFEYEKYYGAPPYRL